MRRTPPRIAAVGTALTVVSLLTGGLWASASTAMAVPVAPVAPETFILSTESVARALEASAVTLRVIETEKAVLLVLSAS